MSTSTRFAYLDNIKILLVCGVIALHASITYGFEGSWYLESYGEMSEPAIVVLTILLGTGWLFGLGLFFLIAGRLTGPSFDRKGAARFSRERIVRLGIPIVFYVFTISPVLEYVAYRENDDGTAGFWTFARDQVWDLAPGPTWFLEALLVFSLGYAALRAISGKSGAERRAPRAEAEIRPSIVAGTVAAIAVCSYLSHFAFPVGEEQFHLQLGMFPQYIAMFSLGVAAGRRGWFETISSRTQNGCAIAGAAGVVAFVVALAAGGFFESDAQAELYAGGPHWQAAAASMAEGIVAVCVSLWVVAHFRRRRDKLSPLAARMAPAAYGAFVLHPPVIVALAFALATLPGPDEVQFVLLLAIGIAGSFGFASLLSRWPPAARVIGASRAVGAANSSSRLA